MSAPLAAFERPRNVNSNTVYFLQSKEVYCLRSTERQIEGASVSCSFSSQVIVNLKFKLTKGN